MKISRRKFFAGAGAAAGTLAITSGSRVAAAQAAKTPKAVGLPDVWGQDFLYQWSPPDNVKRDTSPGPNVIRLSNSQDITNREGTDYAKMFQTMRDRRLDCLRGGICRMVEQENA